jgi:hypothetical protein
MNTRTDIARLRHPWERPVWTAAVALNVLLCVAAVTIVIRGGGWFLDRIPILANYQTHIKAIATFAVFTPVLAVFTRNRRFGRVRGDSVQLSAIQFPAVRQKLLELCARVGMRPPPLLFLSDEAIDGPARAFSAWHVDYIVMSTDLIDRDPIPLRDVWSFIMARELGRMALGHTRWWNELAIAYVDTLPVIHRPLRHVRAYSLDRIGAFLEPEGVRGLVVGATGRRDLPAVNVSDHIRYATSLDGLWYRIANLVEERPHVAHRMHLLYERGLFDLEHDLERFDRSHDGLEQDFAATAIGI